MDPLSGGVGATPSAYLLAFGLASAACFAALARLDTVEDDDTRRGLWWLLVLSGTWAGSHVLFLGAPVRAVQLGAYYLGLVVGFATVGPWLYFCSAYSGRRLHRNGTYRRLAVAVFGVVVLLKLTNPVHGLYFSPVVETAPFPHLAIEHHLLHWLAMGLAYVLTAIGGFMLLELFTLTGYDTRPLAVLLGLTGLPLGLDIVGAATPLLVDMTYEPLGVAVFALGVVSLLSARFRAVRLSSDVDDPAVFVGDGGVVRDANAPAVELFPALSDAVGDRLADRVPTLAAGWMADERVLELDRDGEPRYYRLSTSTLASGDDRFGRMLLIVDITDKERYRREAERQNERLGQLAAVISHDLRNPLNVARGHLELERERRDTESLAAAGTALERMERLIEDLLALTQAGLDIGDCRPVSLAALARAGWSTVDTEDAELVVADDYALLADDDRLRQVFENLFRNSVEHGAVDDRSEGGDGFDPGATATDGGPGRASGGPAVTVGLLPEDAGFFIADDGPGIPADEREAALEFGHSGADGSGLGLAIVDTIVEAHGWTLRITDAEGGGARFEFAGVDPVDPEQVPTAESGGPTGDPWDEAGGGTAWSPDD